MAVAFRVSLDGSTEMSSKSSGRIEPWQFCLSGQIVCLGVIEMIDTLLLTLPDILTESVSKPWVLPLIAGIASYIREYISNPKHT